VGVGNETGGGSCTPLRYGFAPSPPLKHPSKSPRGRTGAGGVVGVGGAGTGTGARRSGGGSGGGAAGKEAVAAAGGRGPGAQASPAELKRLDLGRMVATVDRLIASQQADLKRISDYAHTHAHTYAYAYAYDEYEECGYVCNDGSLSHSLRRPHGGRYLPGEEDGAQAVGGGAGGEARAGTGAGSEGCRSRHGFGSPPSAGGGRPGVSAVVKLPVLTYDAAGDVDADRDDAGDAVPVMSTYPLYANYSVLRPRTGASGASSAGGRDASGRDTSGRDASGRDASGRDASGRDAGGRDASDSRGGSSRRDKSPGQHASRTVESASLPLTSAPDNVTVEEARELDDFEG
jgi:hypothetical protein